MATYTELKVAVKRTVFSSDGTVAVFRQSTLSGKWHVAQMNLTPEEYNRWVEGRALIQDAMPNLTSDEREFLMTGSTPTEWDAMFKEDLEESGE
jgi:hypothetical protein